MFRLRGRLPSVASRCVCARLPRRAVSVLVAAPAARPVQRPLLARTAVSTSGEHVEQLIDDISESEYNHVADEYLEALNEELESLAETYPEIDVELSLGVMTLAVGEHNYVFNKKPPNKQIWFSSPLSGPMRFDMIGGRWITLRDRLSMSELLESELLEVLGTTVKLGLPN